ncbi:hypothetical protein DVH24_013315 [Malus domestica]|uniref:Uncharacterized protein n=1 Tax=Malus domestica TaxID=3750 RepID=A0A498HHV2_MALDO|nr:hypothetical protein DVH24_013315 [Malus domestica]
MASSSNLIVLPTFPNASNFLTIKLDTTNYPLLLAQISMNLVAYVDRMSKCPPAFLKYTKGNITNAVNPDYEAWIQQDVIVISWINSSIYPTVLTYLRERYASQSTKCLLQLRSELMNMHRGDSSIIELIC